MTDARKPTVTLKDKRIDQVLQQDARLEFYRLPGYSPQLNMIEPFETLSRRATRNRLFGCLFVHVG